MLKRIAMCSFALLVTAVAFAGDRPATRPSDAQANASSQDDFPYVIAFEQGASKFELGDGIIITDVRGTSRDMQSGICRISGTYTLTSRDEATLAASVTAQRLADASGPWNSAQTMTIKKGHGTFTLMLPVNVRGWPHVSFYGKTADFGGTYVGSSDSVLRKWWGE